MGNYINYKLIFKIAQATLLSTVLFWILNCLNALVCINISCNPLFLYSSLLVFGFILVLILFFIKKYFVFRLALIVTTYLIFFLFIIPLFIPNISCVTGNETNLLKENLTVSIILLILYLILFFLNFKLNKKYGSDYFVQITPIIIGLAFYFLINYNTPLNFIYIYDYLFYSLIP